MIDAIAIPALLALLATAFALIWLRHRQASKARDGLRAGCLDGCKTLFTHGSKAIMASGFPRLSGHYHGTDFDIQVVPDTLTFRKLPALWLLVSIPSPLPLRATFDMMIRPTGIEPFSRFQNLPVAIATPDGFPPEASLRSDNPDGIPSERLLRHHLGPFADGRAKELVISPKGLRIVWLAEEADRGRYLIFREAELGMKPLDPDTLKPLLDYLVSLREDILAESMRTAAQ